MLKTRLCELLDIKYPIVQAAMAWVTNAEMVAAVSNAGGLGTLGLSAGQTIITRDPYQVGERIRTQIRNVRELTGRPFAVNVLVPGPGEDEFSEATARVVIEENVPIAIVAQGSAEVYTGRLKQAGLKVLHVVANPGHAAKAESAGVDAVITSGTEGGGHSGWEMLTTFVQVPAVADVVKIPVIAGGGVGDARGLVAALALGAEGVYMGTRFIATKECPVHQDWKQALVYSEITDTQIHRHERVPDQQIRGDIQVEIRHGSVRGVTLSEHARQLLGLEPPAKSPEEIMRAPREPPGDEERDMSGSSQLSPMPRNSVSGGGGGQVVGLIKDIPTCEQLIERIIRGAEEIMNRLSKKP